MATSVAESAAHANGETSRTQFAERGQQRYSRCGTRESGDWSGLRKLNTSQRLSPDSEIYTNERSCNPESTCASAMCDRLPQSLDNGIAVRGRHGGARQNALSRYWRGACSPVVPPLSGQPCCLPSSVADTTSLREEQNAIDQLLKAYADADLPGRYKSFLSADSFLHVVPVGVRDSNGTMIPVASLMDQRVSLPEESQRTALQAIQAVLTSISATAGANIVFGGTTDNRLNASFPSRIDSKPAREILDSILLPMNIRCWTLLFDPGAKLHVLVIPLLTLETLSSAK